ncbi:hypothetical protein ONZ51_g1637 [Trametes cubensis]|uniref:NAD-dependent epimerase/dehydratase domain-containing protein n=1 Tax=Trametes cubensis TaxID=1111947 RepID=A0AAD7U116_9APHY|nr:hypothetical protein ONZ51_g1637 [Trametes cubensis]
MPALHPPAKVLVTGANGFVGCWVVYQLLEAGYAVRAAVRTPDKARTLAAQVASKYSCELSARGPFECVVVPDITKEGAFDECLLGVEGVVHTATPVRFDLDDPAEYIEPAVKGTLGILHSAAKHSTVRRIVFTSSIAAVADAIRPPPATVVRTEDDWNDFSVEIVEKTGKAASGVDKYSTSKVRSEKAAWSFYEENKHTLLYDFSVVAPAWIFGPLPDHPRSPADIASTSMMLAWTQMFQVPAPPPSSPPGIYNYVHIFDVAQMHLRVLDTEDAGGKRFLASAGVSNFQDWYDATSTLDGGHFRLLGFEALHPPRALRPDEEKEALPAHTVFSGKRAEKELGIVYKSLAEMEPQVRVVKSMTIVFDLVSDGNPRVFIRAISNPAPSSVTTNPSIHDRDESSYQPLCKRPPISSTLTIGRHSFSGPLPFRALLNSGYVVRESECPLKSEEVVKRLLPELRPDIARSQWWCASIAAGLHKPKASVDAIIHEAFIVMLYTGVPNHPAIGGTISTSKGLFKRRHATPKRVVTVTFVARELGNEALGLNTYKYGANKILSSEGDDVPASIHRDGHHPISDADAPSTALSTPSVSDFTCAKSPRRLVHTRALELAAAGAQRIQPSYCTFVSAEYAQDPVVCRHGRSGVRMDEHFSIIPHQTAPHVSSPMCTTSSRDKV